MEELIYNDFIPSQEDIKKEYKNCLKDPDKVEDLIYDGQIIEYFGLFFDDLYEIFKNAHYSPKTLDDANNFLKQNYYKLDSVSEITGMYTKKIDGKEKLFSVKINRNNFYNAYYMPIWKNLNLKERAQVLKWHFDNKKNLFGIKNLQLRFVEDENSLYCGELSGEYDGTYVYINNYLLFNSNPFELITTIEHEFQHVNQDYNYKYFNREKKDVNNLYEKLILENKDAQMYATSFKISPKEREALYLGYIMEQKAERQSLKEYEKINRANQEFFGVCPEQEEDTKDYIWDFMFRNSMLTVGEVRKSNKKTDQEIKTYILQKKVMKKSNYFSKMALLWITVSNKNYDLRKEEIKIRMDGKQQEKQDRLKEIQKQIKKNEKILAKIDANYKSVLRENGRKLPSSFFKELAIEN